MVGVEPNREMRRHAEMATSKENVRYLGRPSHRTGRRDSSADIVTSAQSLHWMNALATFEEVGRILHRGGVFAACNYQSLLTGNWEVDQAWIEVPSAVRRLRVSSVSTAACDDGP